MIVKINTMAGDTIFDSSKTPILIILTDKEKELISNMGNQDMFCSFPEGMNTKVIEDFMKVEGDS